MSLIRFHAVGKLSSSELAALREATGRSVAVIAGAAKAGALVAEFRLFKKDHSERAASLEGLMNRVDEAAFSLLECVVDPETGTERCHPTSFAIVKNILADAEQISRDLDRDS